MVRVAIVAATRTIAFKSGVLLLELVLHEIALCGAVLSGVVLLELQLQLF